MKRDLSTPENREFWEFIDKIVKKVSEATWQKGAVTPKDEHNKRTDTDTGQTDS